ncbi:MAG: UDP-N-acetylglucosamine 2-epimerase, partial [Thermoplasmata archaeon]|nr:UDP-N-acetylglucosamine 2-epimerase [Thermoplasmata archaeon]
IEVVNKYNLKKPQIYFSIHRRETTMVQERFEGPVKAVLEMTDYNFFVSMRPGTRKALEKYDYLKDLENADHISVYDSIPSYVETICIMKNCDALLTDSGSMLEEAAGLKVPCLTARYITDRPETVTAGSNILVGLEKEAIIENLRKVVDDQQTKEKMITASGLYGDGDSSKKILEITEELHSSGDLLLFEKEISTKNI